MVQILATTFFSAVSLAATTAIVASIAENFGDIRIALRLTLPVAPLPSARVRVGRVVTMRGLIPATAAMPLRAAA